MDTKDLKKLRRSLPKGSKKILAEQFDVSEGHITQILLGNRKNEKVIIAAAIIAYDHKNELSKAEQIVQSLADII